MIGSAHVYLCLAANHNQIQQIKYLLCFFALCAFCVSVCLTGAVRKSRVSEKATDTEINQHTIRWFNLACDHGVAAVHVHTQQLMTRNVSV